jgi:hypothetical protein
MGARKKGIVNTNIITKISVNLKVLLLPIKVKIVLEEASLCYIIYWSNFSYFMMNLINYCQLEKGDSKQQRWRCMRHVARYTVWDTEGEAK